MIRTPHTHHGRRPALQRPAPILMLALAVLLSWPLGAAAQEESEAVPRVEVVFVLDTTGSMSGLIEGAKAKIWDIANLIVSAEPTPDVRFGLVGYRDRGDAYITQFFDLSEDIDAIYGHLMGFSAEGGGDTPESVNQALADAVERMSWSPDDPNGPKVLRIIFLVGDAPPHTDYGDTPYSQSAERAARQGIVINAIQCGNLGGTEPVWREIASLAGGDYSAIAQDGDVHIVATPFDAELARLNRDLGTTLVGYGRAEEREAMDVYQALSEAAAPSATADRLSYNRSRDLVGGSGGDLVDAVNNGTVDLGGLDDDALPEAMRGMNEAERAAYIAEQTERRTALQAEIDGLLAERQGYLATDRRRRAEAGELTGFDAEVERTIRAQAAEAGISFAE